MRVCIDATPVLLRSAGVKNYVYHWIRALEAASSNGSISAFPYLRRFGDLDHEHSVLGFLPTYARLALLYFVNIPGNPALDRLTSGLDIFHASNQIRNPPRRVLLTATVHDLTCWLSPEMHTAANVRADKTFADRVLRRAAGLIAVSESTRGDAIRILGIAPERIRAIHSGIPDAFFRAVPGDVPLKYGIHKPYVLYVGTIEPRKNLDTLLDAWGELPASIRDEFELVVAGPPGWSSERTAARLERGESGVRYLGYVAEADLPALNSGATVFAYPSLYEGFGFPIAQAMAAGVAVLTSNVSALPEVAGDGGLLVDPRSRAEIRDSLQRLLLSPDLRARLAAAGRLRASRYTWQTCARESLAFFEEIAGRL